ncbi:MAG: IMPACT family protein [Nannocystaceae bacterium]
MTVTAPSRHEISRIKGSRFFASVFPAATVEQALACVDQLRAEFSDATHHCWAWRGRTRDTYRYADDGEPSGCAGKPILAAMDGRNLADVAVVVTRYYGGTKLGTGGLVRAYGLATAEALVHASIVATATTTEVQLAFDYTLSGAVESVLHAFGLQAHAADYGVRVTLEVAVPDDAVEDVLSRLRERCAGRIEARRSP